MIIPYEPATFKQKHIYSICNMMAVDGKTEAGSVRFVPFPGKAVKAKLQLNGLDANTEYKLRINLYGAMGENCENVGTEFNPLREINRWGEQNPYQDPKRGRFDNVTSNGDGVVDEMQDKLL